MTATKTKSRPQYNAVGEIPEGQLRILADLFSLAHMPPEGLGELSADEAALRSFGWIKYDAVRDRISLTPKGRKEAPNSASAAVRFSKFADIAQMVAASIENNAAATLQENGLPHWQSVPHTYARLCAREMSSAEDTYGDTYPDEIADLKRAGFTF